MISGCFECFDQACAECTIFGTRRLCLVPLALFLPSGQDSVESKPIHIPGEERTGGRGPIHFFADHIKDGFRILVTRHGKTPDESR